MRNNTKIFFSLLLIPLLIIWVFRGVFIVQHMSMGELQSMTRHLPLAFMNSMRFDMQVAGYAMIVPLLLLIIGIKRVVMTIYMTFAAAVLTAICITDLGFYHNFNSHFNVTLFDFFNEGPVDLMRVIWEEYHVVCYMGIVAMIAYVVYKYSERVMASFQSARNIWARL